MTTQTMAAAAAGEAATTTMLAILHPRYGSPDVLRLGRIDKPAVGDDEVRVRVHAASVCKGDAYILSGTPYFLRLMGYGLLRPRQRVLGQSVAGRIEAVGRNVRQLRPGDDVFGQVFHGAFAEFVSARAECFAPKPANLDYEQAAAAPSSGLTALQGLRDSGGLRPGQSVLINGASGSVGTFAVQIAKALGAEVTAVCSTRHVELIRALGADRVVDYTKEDFARRSERYDVAFDLVGNRSLADWKRILAPTGVFVSCTAGKSGDWIGPLLWLAKVALAGAFGRRKMTPFMERVDRADLLTLKELIEAGQVTPVIERRYPFRETAEAIRHVASWHTQGTSVICMP